MAGLSKVFDESRFDTQQGVLVVLSVDDVTHGKRAEITAVPEVAGAERLQPHLVEDPALPSAVRKNTSRDSRLRSRDVFIFVVFLGAANDPVLGNVRNDLGDFILGKRKVHDQTGSILDVSLFAGHKRGCCAQKNYGADLPNVGRSHCGLHWSMPEALSLETDRKLTCCEGSHFRQTPMTRVVVRDEMQKTWRQGFTLSRLCQRIFTVS